MKNLILSFCVLFSMTTMAQTIRRVNNNPGVTGVNVYATLQAAHDAAVANDVISVEPSANAYGTLTVTKLLTIVGAGYFLDKLPAGGPSDTRNATMSTLTFDNGSAGSSITGMDVNTTTNIRDINITLNRSNLKSITFGTNQVGPANTTRGNNAVVNNCIITGGGITGNNSATVTSQYGYNCVFSNNIIYGYFNNISNSAIVNNTVAYFIYTTNNASNTGCSFSNNIFDCRGMTTTLNLSSIGLGNSMSNNLFAGTGTFTINPTGNANVIGDPNATYISLTTNPWSTYSTEDSKFQLAAGSPAIGIGTAGVNAGAFGGAAPYLLSGLPAYPYITNFSASGIGNATTPLNVNVSIKSNN
jgi:hypothetical protein